MPDPTRSDSTSSGPTSRSGSPVPEHSDAAASGHHHGSSHGQGMPAGDGASEVRPAVDDPMHVAAPAGHGTHAGHGGHGMGHGGMDHVAMFRRLFWLMLALAVPTV